jgi:hypothetical protein
LQYVRLQTRPELSKQKVQVLAVFLRCLTWHTLAAISPGHLGDRPARGGDDGKAGRDERWALSPGHLAVNRGDTEMSLGTFRRRAPPALHREEVMCNSET